VAIKSIQDFIANPGSKVIARDYLYLGLSKLKKANNIETKVVDQAMFAAGVADIKKSVEMEINMTNDLSEVGEKILRTKIDSRKLQQSTKSPPATLIQRTFYLIISI